MPRGKKKQTLTGERAQKVESVVGQRYGEGKAQQQMQRAMPAPQREEVTASGGRRPEPSAPVGAVRSAPDPAVIQEFLRANNPNLLAGSQKPDQPITAGMSTGPGPGPEALGTRAATTPAGRFMRRLAQDSGDERWLLLAQRARL